MPRMQIPGSRLRALGPTRLRSFSASLAQEANPEPSVFATMEVLARSDSGLFSDAAGTTPQETVGQQVKAWTNYGSGDLLSLGDFGLGPLLAVENGVNVLDCTPSGNDPRVLGCDVPSGGTENLTLYFVAKMVMSGMGEAKNKAWTLKGTDDNSGDFPVFLFDRSYGHTMGVGGENLGLSNNPLPVVDDGWHVGAFRRTVTSGANGTWDVFYDGVKFDTAHVTASTTIDRCNIGGPQAGFSGKFAFIGMARTAAHSDGDIAEVTAYLQAEFSDLVPTYDKVAVVVGDSKSSATLSQVSSLDSTYAPEKYSWGQAARSLRSSGDLDALWVIAWDGAKTSDHRAVSVARIAALLNLGASKKVLAIYLGTNGMVYGGLTPAQEYAQITSLISDVRALVPDVIVLVEPTGDGNPVTWGAGYPADRAALIGLIEDGDNQALHDYTAGTVSADPVGYAWGTPGRDAAFYYGNDDGLHCVGPGMDREAAVFITDLAALL